MSVDQSQRGLLIPAWADGRLALVVAEGEFAGMTIPEVAKRAGVTAECAKRRLLDGELPERPLPPGRKLQDPVVRAWLDNHFPPHTTATEAAVMLKVIPSTIARMAEQDRQPGDIRKHVPKVLGGQAQRKQRRAPFVVAWIQQHAPGLSEETIRDMANHYRVTEKCLRDWARQDIAPKVGGYKRGELAQLAGKEPYKPTPPRREAKPKPAPAVVQARPVCKRKLLAAFVDELRLRAPVKNRMNRIFLAGIRV